jgi:hypothetical protein
MKSKIKLGLGNNRFAITIETVTFWVWNIEEETG